MGLLDVIGTTSAEVDEVIEEMLKRTFLQSLPKGSLVIRILSNEKMYLIGCGERDMYVHYSRDCCLTLAWPIPYSQFTCPAWKYYRRSTAYQVARNMLR